MAVSDDPSPRRFALCARPSDADCSIKKRVCAFVVPIGSRGRLKTSQRAAV